MMRGRVSGLRLLIAVAFRATSGVYKAVNLVVDTGFEGALTLSSADIAALGLPKVQLSKAILADGSQTNIQVYGGVILWHGIKTAVAVFAMDGDPLLGASLLQDNLLLVDWVDGGEVRIDPRP